MSWLLQLEAKMEVLPCLIRPSWVLTLCCDEFRHFVVLGSGCCHSTRAYL